MPYCLYLRKSRADKDAELLSGEETLARHERALLDLARQHCLNVIAIYREVVSGETIQSRPVMRHLLGEIEDGLWEGVLVMEIERLARGATIDQGVVAQAFQLSNTKIITPLKTYDPNNEFDEEYFEFGLFMSRREYKSITRRMQRGRLASVNEGKYVGNKTPYGYVKVKLEHEKGYTLAPHPGHADIVRLIFRLYVHGENGQTYGCTNIAHYLNNLGVPAATGIPWTTASIRSLLANPVYTGKIRWNARKSVKKIENGRVTHTRPRAKPNECTVVDGLHPAIVDEKLFEEAQACARLGHRPSVPHSSSLLNPLAGIVKCALCGHAMQRRPYQSGYPDSLMCITLRCANVSSRLSLVEEKILLGLGDLLGELQIEQPADTPDEAQMESLQMARQACERETGRLLTQMDSLHDLLEQGVYDKDMFLSRSSALRTRMDSARQSLEKVNSGIAALEQNLGKRQSLIPQIRRILSVYESSSPAVRNNMLKSVLLKVSYIKTTPAHLPHDPSDFQVTLYPRFSLRENHI